MVIFLVILGVLLFLGVAFYLDYKRKQMWRELAARYGLRYDSGDPLQLVDHYPFALFKPGRGKRVSNTLWGNTAGMDVVLFDYCYSTGSGKQIQTHHCSALMVRLPCRGELHITPETFWDRIAAVFGWDDYDFEYEYERFNRAFQVTGPDKKFAYDICNSQMMEFLLEHPKHCWEIQGDQLLLYSYYMGTFDAAEVERCLHDARGFLDRLPAYLLQK